jgi:hypothetical protein
VTYRRAGSNSGSPVWKRMELTLLRFLPRIAMLTRLDNILIEIHQDIKALSLGKYRVAERSNMLPFVEKLVDTFYVTMEILPQVFAYIGIVKDRTDGVGLDMEDIKNLFHGYAVE